jgi:hypothetical protein
MMVTEFKENNSSGLDGHFLQKACLQIGIARKKAFSVREKVSRARVRDRFFVGPGLAGHTRSEWSNC